MGRREREVGFLMVKWWEGGRAVREVGVEDGAEAGVAMARAARVAAIDLERPFEAVAVGERKAGKAAPVIAL